MWQNLIVLGFVLALLLVGAGLVLTMITRTPGSPSRKRASAEASAAGAYTPVWWGGGDSGGSCGSDGGGSAGCDGGGGAS